MKGQKVIHSHENDNFETPRAIFEPVDREFHFDCDAAAHSGNSLCRDFMGPGSSMLIDDPLTAEWIPIATYWLNPPYSQTSAFLDLVSRNRESLWAVLIPSRTDTRYWHTHIWDVETNQARPGVELRFFKGRIRFNVDGKPATIRTGKNAGKPASAPFPSVLVIFRPL